MAHHLLSSDFKRVTAITATMMMPGSPLMGAPLDHATKLPIEILRPFGIGLKQIEYCLLQERGNDLTALFPAEDDHKCPIDRKR
jgi:hypothetical protein